MNNKQGQGKKKSESWLVQGKTPLTGCVRLGGAKNASYKLMIASLLGNDTSRILNLPDISDVRMVGEIINNLGGQAEEIGNKTFLIDPRSLKKHSISREYGEKSRASSLFLAPLVSKFGQGSVPLPGGDRIGKRPLDRHMEGLKKMGVKIGQKDNVLSVKVKNKDGRLHGCRYRFEKNTHTGTEFLIMAAVLAKGKTILENAALEPEIDDLIIFLNKMGARIRRRAFRVIEIEGVDTLAGAIHKTMPDRNEAVSYACAAIASQGDIIIENAAHSDLKAFIEKVEEAQGGVEVGDYGIRFFYDGHIRATDVVTEIHPGFMTDWQPLWATLMCQAHGESVIHETVMQNRFSYIEKLRTMGAKIDTFTPEVDKPEKVYNFNWSDRKDTDIRAIKIHGPSELHGGEFEVHDLRAGATIMIAAIGAEDKTILHNVEQIKRGYEKIDEKLSLMGANITKV